MSQDDLERIRQRLSEYYKPDEIETWLHSPHPRLGGHWAYNLILAGRASEVDRLLDELDSGAFT